MPYLINHLGLLTMEARNTLAIAEPHAKTLGPTVPSWWSLSWAQTRIASSASMPCRHQRNHCPLDQNTSPWKLQLPPLKKHCPRPFCVSGPALLPWAGSAQLSWPEALLPFAAQSHPELFANPSKHCACLPPWSEADVVRDLLQEKAMVGRPAGTKTPNENHIKSLQ